MGEEDPILVLSDTAPSRCVGEITELLGGDDIRIHIEYDSIYDDRYSFDGSAHFNDDAAERAAALYQQLDTLHLKLGNLQAEINALANHGVATPTRQ